MQHDATCFLGVADIAKPLLKLLHFIHSKLRFKGQAKR